MSKESVSWNVAETLRRKLRAQWALAHEFRLPPPTPTNPVEIDDTTECSVPIASVTVASDTVCIPESYKRLGTKEKLVLLFAENCQRQYKERFPHRKPLIHALPNECGVQKFVCTSLKPSAFLFPDIIGSWEEIASFVADYIVYEPLPDQINIETKQAEQRIGS